MKKVLLVLALCGFFASCQEEASNSAPSLNETNQAQAEGLPEGLEELEDCDEKAKKVEENIEVNLGGGGDAGCTIE